MFTATYATLLTFLLLPILVKGIGEEQTIKQLESLIASFGDRISELEKKLGASVTSPKPTGQTTNVTQTGSKTQENKHMPAIPTSCVDVRKLGHTSSGFYYVNTKNEIESVFCNMEQHDNTSTVTQQRIGTTEIKTTPVYFYVLNTGYGKEHTILPFQVVKLNIGAAMNHRTGIFTAPRAGVYSFACSIMKEGRILMGEHLVIYLQVNGVTVSLSSAVRSSHEDDDSAPAGFHSLLMLQKGDRVNLYLQYGHTAILDVLNVSDALLPLSHFTGMLVHEIFDS